MNPRTRRKRRQRRRIRVLQGKYTRWLRAYLHSRAPLLQKLWATAAIHGTALTATGEIIEYKGPKWKDIIDEAIHKDVKMDMEPFREVGDPTWFGKVPVVPITREQLLEKYPDVRKRR